jgi:transketolase
MGIEDITLMRALPTMGVFQPMDARETEFIMDYLVKEWKGPAYLRLTRQNLPDLFPKDMPFRPGKLMEVRNPATGRPPQVICIATGASVAEAVQASDRLNEKGIQMAVWNAHCLKPFDEQGVLNISQHSQLVVTVEDHTVIGGLGSCVAEALAQTARHSRLIRLGVQDIFGESGDPAELYDKFGISAQAIAARVAKELHLED